jgi:hypothetical protein
MPTFYIVVAYVVKTDASGTTSYQVPTFYLNADIQGIVSKEQAERIALEVVNPTRDPSLQVHVTVKVADRE